MDKKNTGIFYHDICKERDIDWLLSGRLNDFPEVLEESGILKKPNIHFYESEPTPEDMLQKVHTKELIERVKKTEYYKTALYSTGGTVQAAKLILEGEINNAFVFTGSADHHSGINNFWGGCHFNGAALAIENLELERYCILDTDHHHGDGTRDIFKDNKNVLHICFCGGFEYDKRDNETNIDVKIPSRTYDDEYIKKVIEEFIPRVTNFNPDMIFWEFGYDNTIGDYGDIGLTKDCHLKIAEIVKEVSDDICESRVICILCGGSDKDTASYVIPKIINTFSKY